MNKKALVAMAMGGKHQSEMMDVASDSVTLCQMHVWLLGQHEQMGNEKSEPHFNIPDQCHIVSSPPQQLEDNWFLFLSLNSSFPESVTSATADTECFSFGLYLYDRSFVPPSFSFPLDCPHRPIIHPSACFSSSPVNGIKRPLAAFSGTGSSCAFLLNRKMSGRDRLCVFVCVMEKNTSHRTPSQRS